MRKFLFLIIILSAGGLLLWLYPPSPTGPTVPDKEVKEAGTFDECVKEGNPVRESYPPVCVTKSGQVLTQNIGNEPELKDKIKISNPRPAEVVKSPLVVNGEARGTWFFEGQFTATLFDSDGNPIGSGLMTTDGEWMTEDFIPYSGQIMFPDPTTDTGKLILEKDNPSSLVENAEQLIVPVRFK